MGPRPHTSPQDERLSLQVAKFEATAARISARLLFSEAFVSAEPSHEKTQLDLANVNR